MRNDLYPKDQLRKYKLVTLWKYRKEIYNLIRIDNIA